MLKLCRLGGSLCFAFQLVCASVFTGFAERLGNSVLCFHRLWAGELGRPKEGAFQLCHQLDRARTIIAIMLSYLFVF